MRIAIVTDSHLAPDAAAFNTNWSAARDFIASVDAELTVHLGDVTVDGVHDLSFVKTSSGSKCLISRSRIGTIPVR